MNLAQVFAYSFGVLAVHALAVLPSPLLLAVCALPALWPWRGRALCALALLGALLAVWQAQGRLAERWPDARHGEDVSVSGHILTLPQHRERQRGEVWRFDFAPLPESGLPRRVRVSWYEADATPKAGDCWQFTLRLRTPHGSLNPGAFDYEGWLYRQGIGATASVRDAAPCAVPGPRLPALRQQWAAQLQAALPAHPGLPLLAAQTLGDDSGLADADWDRFRRTGTTHLMVVSGLQVAIMAGCAFFLFRALWSLWPPLCLRLPAQKAGMAAALLAALGYALMAGFEPPLQRALIMFALLTAAAWAGRLHLGASALGLAWVMVLALDPSAVLAPGLWLSFGAVAAIFYIGAHRHQSPPWWLTLLRLQLLLSLLLAPLTLYFFGGLALWSPLVNLLAVPLFVVLTPLLFAGVILHALWPALGHPLLWAGAESLAWLYRGLVMLDATAPAAWLALSPPPAALALALLGAVLLFAPRGLPLRVLGLLCLLPLTQPPQTAPQAGYTLDLLDVGQGLAVVIRTPHHTLLYDAGPAYEEGFDAGESIVAPWLLRQGIRRLDVLMLSHGDNDHAGGVPAVRERLRVLREVGTDAGAPCRAGERWQWDGVQFELLHPDEGVWSENNRSCVLRVESPGFVSLLAGDIERRAEQHLLRTLPGRMKADVLVAPHHGSLTSSTPDFVRAVHPQWVLYGAGWRHHYRHPRPEVMARYAELGTQQAITGHHGALSVRLKDGALQVSGWRTQGARFWNHRLLEIPPPQRIVGFGASP